MREQKSEDNYMNLKLLHKSSDARNMFRKIVLFTWNKLCILISELVNSKTLQNQLFYDCEAIFGRGHL